jgi:hypothetical protein
MRLAFASLSSFALVLAAACSGDDEVLESPPDAAPGPTADAGAGPPLRIVTVDETGAPVPARRVVWQPAPADPFWLTASEATCVGGGPPPCSAWEVAAPITTRIVVSAERTTEAPASEACLPYASTFAIVHPGTPAVPSQLLHLTLPKDGTYCIDPETFRTVVNHDHDELLDATDVLAAPAPASGAIEVRLVDLQGAPVPGSAAHWYYPPDSPEYDGEHALACVDQRCETWVVTDVPRPGPIYLNASYAGPLNPTLQQGWSSYAAGPFEVMAGADGTIVPLSTTFELETDLEGAIGGDRPPRSTP